MNTSSAMKFRVVVLCLLSLLILTLSPLFGVKLETSATELLFGSGVASEVFWRIRLPRVALGLLAGASLGTAGLVFQALFRNSLASPYTLGVASGASFGAAMGIQLGASWQLLGLSSSTVGGLLGASSSIFLIHFIALRLTTRANVGMLLAGVVLSFFFGSLLLFAQYFSDFTQSFLIVRWLMGGLTVVDFPTVFSLAPIVLLGIGFACSRSAELDAIASGEEFALGLGVDVPKWRNALFIGMSLMVGVVVSFVGPIAFIGIMVPHICRAILGPSHALLTPLTALCSGAFLVACDAIARSVLAPADIPVGIITALLGGPFFLWILLRKRGRLAFGY